MEFGNLVNNGHPSVHPQVRVRLLLHTHSAASYHGLLGLLHLSLSFSGTRTAPMLCLSRLLRSRRCAISLAYLHTGGDAVCRLPAVIYHSLDLSLTQRR